MSSRKVDCNYMYEYLTSTVVLLVVSKIYINLQFKLLILHVSKFICHGQRLKTYEHRRRGAAASPTAATIRLFVHSGSITRHVVSHISLSRCEHVSQKVASFQQQVPGLASTHLSRATATTGGCRNM